VVEETKKRTGARGGLRRCIIRSPVGEMFMVYGVDSGIAEGMVGVEIRDVIGEDIRRDVIGEDIRDVIEKEIRGFLDTFESLSF
jgi:molybdopterin biosynthesis enzyme MoaB